MPRRIFDLEAPDRFAPAVVEDRGARSYFLQAAQGSRVVSVQLEQEQVAVLADRMLAIIDELERRGLAAIDAGPAGTIDERPVAEPVHEAFRVGTMTIAWDDDVDELVVEAHSMMFDAGVGESAVRGDGALESDDIPDDAPVGPDVLRVHLSPVMAQRFARRAGAVVDASRLSCPWCGTPLDPGGHHCSGRQEGGFLH